ncbi:MAG: hypothetical protein AMJ62_13220 [Myxococcales bacterium SG8_38]|nr:MAG: hypothetical protein AMJ62_13220 [Myxococcales bacterium SG8_38]
MSELAAPHILALTAYEPGKPADELTRELGIEDVVKLASNENPYGPSQRAIEAVSGASLIDLICRVCASRAEHAVFGHPSFPCYRIASIAQELDHTAVALRDHLHWNVDDLLDAVTPATKLMFVANPNNPTGSYISGPELERLLRSLPERVLAVVDEAYVEYADAADFKPATELRGARERLAVLRTFSKAYGLAALRVGYVIGTPELIGHLDRLRAPFNVGTAGQVGARSALEDQAHLRASVEATIRDRHKLTAALEAEGLRVAPSQANFVLVDVSRPGRAVYEALLQKGIIVRPMPEPLASWIRVTVGLPRENERFLEALRAVLRRARV